MSLSFVIDDQGSQSYSDTSLLSSDQSHYVPILYTLQSPLPLGDIPLPGPPEYSAHTCFNCGSDSHMLRACPKPHDKSAILAASLVFRRDTPSVGFKRFHEVAENIAWRVRCLDYFAAGSIRLPELRDALGLDDQFISEHEQWRRFDELPWYAGEYARGNRGMVVWGYPPGYYSVEGGFL